MFEKAPGSAGDRVDYKILIFPDSTSLDNVRCRFRWTVKKQSVILDTKAWKKKSDHLHVYIIGTRKESYSLIYNQTICINIGQQS